MKRHQVKLSEEERSKLQTFVRTGHRSAQAISRARILLLADEQGEVRNDAEIARTLEVNIHTVEANRKRGRRAVLHQRLHLAHERVVAGVAEFMQHPGEHQVRPVEREQHEGPPRGGIVRAAPEVGALV